MSLFLKKKIITATIVKIAHLLSEAEAYLRTYC